MDAIEAIYARRSIRSYEDKPVDKEHLITLLKAATAAPTAVNAQPWEFIVTEDAARLAQVRAACTFGRYNAPAAIVVCGNMQLALKGKDHELWVQDCSAATENILIAATSLGLGTVWIGIYPVEPRVRAIKQIFDIPEHVIPMCIIYVGHPAQEKPPRTQYNERRIYWGAYDPGRKHRTKHKPVSGHR